MTKHSYLILVITALIVIVSLLNSQTTRRYGSWVQEVTEIKLSSMTIEGYYVGKDTVAVEIDFYDRNVIVYNAGPKTVWFSGLPTATTYYSPGLPPAFPLTVGEKYYPQFYGQIYFVNDDLSVSSSTILVLKEADK